MIKAGLKKKKIYRKLKLVNEKNKKNKKSKKILKGIKKRNRKLQKKAKIRDYLIEPAGEMIKKRRSAINILDYQIHFQSDGMNPIQNF